MDRRAFGVACAMALAGGAAAAPVELTHQGRLIDATGAPVHGPQVVVFTVYDAGGTARWTESQTVAVESGYFSAVLGRTVTLDDAWVGAGSTVEVSVGGTPLAPRQPLTSTPRAALAGRLARASQTLRGAELTGTGSVVDGMAIISGALDTAGGGYGAGTTDLVVTTANSPYVLPNGVNEFRNVTVQAGATLTAAPFNGYEGGRVEIRATGTVTIAGTIDLTGRGYRGGKAVNINPSDQWTPVAMQTGQPGESYTGAGNVLVPYDANGGGGGGGEVDNCSYAPGGGGGAYGTAGGDAPNATVVSSGPCRYGLQIRNNNSDATFDTFGRAQLARGGRGGGVYGDAAITTLHLGSGGGASGSDADCYKRRGGHGGDGGGAVGIWARSISVTGSVLANGRAGGAAVNEGGNTCSYGGNNGGGGGGAGGSIKLVANTLTVSGTLNALGGGGGAGLQTEFVGGAGGSGRIRLEATSSTIGGTIQVGSGLRSDATGGTGDGQRGTWTSPLLDFSGQTGRFQQVDLFATTGPSVAVSAWLCVGASAADTLLDANCSPIAPSGAVDAPAGAFGRVKLVVVDKSPDRAFSLSGVRVSYGP